MSQPRLATIVRSDVSNRREVHRWVQRGLLRRIAQGAYTSDMETDLEEVVRANLWEIVGILAPDSVISYRTGLRMRPSEEGVVELEGPRRILRLPGATVRITDGPGPLPTDTPVFHSLFLASDARLLLRNLSASRASKYGRRTVAVEVLEEWLDRKIAALGPGYPTALIAEAEEIARPLQAEKELDSLRDLVGRVLGTRTGPPVSVAGRARARGEPVDHERRTTLTWLMESLLPTPGAPAAHMDPAPLAFRNAAFLDAYFSNYIEGNEFEVGEARDIVFSGRIPKARPADSHDLVAAYRILSSRQEMLLVGAGADGDFETFVDTLRERHRQLMVGRPEVMPGQFKPLPNQAGGYSFVEPQYVLGTLREGFELSRFIEAPMDRALFLGFLVAEVHPFVDGNGRLSRITMNGELLKAGLERALVPTSLRTDYLLALRSLSNRNRVEPFRSVMRLGQRLLSRADVSDLPGAIDALRRAGAFEERPERHIKLPE